jgi:hypothetical protein
MVSEIVKACLVSLLFVATSVLGKHIVPGGRWRDTDGNIISAHAGGINFIKEEGKFYWFGEWKIQGHVEGTG